MPRSTHLDPILQSSDPSFLNGEFKNKMDGSRRHIPRHPGKYLLRFGVLGMFWGSKYLLRRCLDV